ncbi:iron uptake transporter permease EfeU [Gordonia shandongensis]|uniref:iron uptake transporter permease EfeU n=1 Tax=Gordonia shandongensis TaxID=376351 RepID=UPI0004058B7E|nr:iron uptake transporter permease EfeU [Gordonia shandongensis]
MTSVIAQGTPSVITQMVGSGLIGVREGLEAGIVVMVLVAFAVKSDRRDALRWIWLGVAAALALMIGTFLIIQFGSSTISPFAAELLAGIASLIAVGIVTGMVLWMRQAAAHISGDLKSGMTAALTAGGVAVFGLAFLAVGREGFETALLMVSYAESVSGGIRPLLGLLIGIVIAVVLTWLLYRGAIAIDFRTFFTYTGFFLIVVAAGILTYGIGALQTVGWLPLLEGTAFNASSWYDQNAWYGVILGGVFNVRPDPSWLQVIAWVAYLGVVGPLFAVRGLPDRSAASRSAPADEPAA